MNFTPYFFLRQRIRTHFNMAAHYYVLSLLCLLCLRKKRAAIQKCFWVIQFSLIFFSNERENFQVYIMTHSKLFLSSKRNASNYSQAEHFIALIKNILIFIKTHFFPPNFSQILLIKNFFETKLF